MQMIVSKRHQSMQQPENSIYYACTNVSVKVHGLSVYGP